MNCSLLPALAALLLALRAQAAPHIATFEPATLAYTVGFNTPSVSNSIAFGRTSLFAA